MKYKEKYERGLECLQEILNGAGESIKTSILRKRLQPFFPELKDDKDERIRKVIYGWICTQPPQFFDINCFSKEEMLAWVEKQGEQKNTRKREIDDAYLQCICDAKHEIEKQGKTLDANEVTKPHWISVEDELPPMKNEDGMSDKVLTHSKGGVIYMNRYDYRGNTWGNPLAFNVTHWMPLPAPPSGSSEFPNNCEKGGKE